VADIEQVRLRPSGTGAEPVALTTQAAMEHTGTRGSVLSSSATWRCRACGLRVCGSTDNPAKGSDRPVREHRHQCCLCQPRNTLRQDVDCAAAVRTVASRALVPDRS
jgi:hypothetical protein